MWRKSLRFSSKFLTSKNSLYLSSISSSSANDVVRHSLSQSYPYGIRALSAATAVSLASGATKASSHWAGRRHGRCYWELSKARLSFSACAFAIGHEHEEVEAQHEANNLTTGRNSTSEPSGTYSGHYGQNIVQLQPKLSGACADGSRDPQQSSNQYNQSYNRVFKRSTRHEFLTYPLQQDGNFCGHNGQENGGLLQTPELD